MLPVIMLPMIMIALLLFRSYIAPPYVSDYAFSVGNFNTFCYTNILIVKVLVIFMGAGSSLL